MNRRKFLTALSAAFAAPALPLQAGWFWRDDTLIIEGQIIELDANLDLSEYPSVILRRCLIQIRSLLEDGRAHPQIILPNEGSATIEECVFNYDLSLSYEDAMADIDRYLSA